MNQPKFEVKLPEYEQVNVIAGGWSAIDYRKLLEEMDFASEDATGKVQLRELCVMCLQDMELSEAAKVVLKYRLGDKLTAGQIQSVSEEISDEKLWEQYADQSLHEQFFHVGNLIYGAFPREMDEPDAVRLIVEITGKNQEAKEILASPLHESFVVRLLADGMDDSSILHRLFDEQLAGKSFPEADSIIWMIKPVSASAEDQVSIEVYSSCHWLDALNGVEKFESSAVPDKVPAA